MRTCDIRFPGFDAGSNRGLIRWELFLHSDVRDVLLTRRDDTLRIVFRGDPDPSGWAQTLTEAGFPSPHFERRASDAVIDSPRDAAA
jgi:hypothetical protein